MISNTLVYFENKSTFEEELNSGEISTKSIVFIRETGEIWTHGKYYTEYEKVKKVLFESGPGSVADAIKNLRKSILGGASEDYNTLSKIEAFLKHQEIEEGPGISIIRGEDNKQVISVKIDNESIISNNNGELRVKTVDGGTY